MPDSALLSILTGSGVAGVFCILFIAGLVYPRSVVADLKTEIAELKEAVAAERGRADAAVTAASATRDILIAIQVGHQLQSGRGP